jgi:transposase
VSEVIEGDNKPVAPKRIHRSVEEKRRIVEATFAPGTSIARVAREHGVNSYQVFQWRYEYRKGILGNGPKSRTKLLPVVVEETASSSVETAAVPQTQKSTAIRIEFSGGISIQISTETDLYLLRTIVEMLRS